MRRECIAVGVTGLLGLGAPAGAYAQAQQAPEAVQQPRPGFVEPPAWVDPVYLPKGPDTYARADRPPPDDAAARLGLSLRLALDWPLRASEPAPATGLGAQGAPPVSPTLQASVRWVPQPSSGWFAQATLYRYLRPERQQPWNPDFSYAFGWDDWRPGTFGFIYGNYAGNRLNPDRSRGERRWNFLNGQWSAFYKFSLPEPLRPLFVIDADDQVTCTTALNLTPRYTDLDSAATRRNKVSVGLGCRYVMPSNWYANFTLFGYPRSHQQQPWDPDFTYGFGYFDWRAGTVSLQYNNYSGNRFPWRDRGPNQGSVRNGSITLSWSTQW
ncbi:hypothetical protein WG922_02580 [Ramlibacter sp. AN1015]|uniref:hypothetical protein n=1 Tax=Ramlibacter sp. AN1015 TaxID=3133428 RepID=UPI0030BF1F07